MINNEWNVGFSVAVILIDIFNVIESIREHGLNAMDPYAILTVPKVESVVTSLYVNLNKRLPPGQQVDVTSCARYLLSWMLIAYDKYVLLECFV